MPSSSEPIEENHQSDTLTKSLIGWLTGLIVLLLVLGGVFVYLLKRRSSKSGKLTTATMASPADEGQPRPQGATLSHLKPQFCLPGSRVDTRGTSTSGPSSIVDGQEDNLFEYTQMSEYREGFREFLAERDGIRDVEGALDLITSLLGIHRPPPTYITEE